MSKKLFGIFLAFGVFFVFFGGSSAFATHAPQEIVNELTQKCNGGEYYERDYFGRQRKESFDNYGYNNAITTSWISSNSSGLDIINSLGKKVEYTLPSNQRYIYLNFASRLCRVHHANYTITRAKILNDGGERGLNVDKPYAISDSGNGYYFAYSQSGLYNVKRVGTIRIEITNERIKSLRSAPAASKDKPNSRWLKFRVGHGVLNYHATSVPPGKVPGGYDHDYYYETEFSLLVNIGEKPTPKPEPTPTPPPSSSHSAQTYVKSTSLRGWHSGRENLGKYGDSVSFNHIVTTNFQNSVPSGGIDTSTKNHSWSNENGEVSPRGGSFSGSDINRNSGTIVAKDQYLGKYVCDRTHYKYSFSPSYKSYDIIGYHDKRDKNGKYLGKDYSRPIRSWVHHGGLASVQNGTGISPQEACVYIPYEYEVIPCVSTGIQYCGGDDIPSERGTRIHTTQKITNNGTPTPEDSKVAITTWEVPQNEESHLTQGGSAGYINSSNPCTHYRYTFKYPPTTLRNCHEDIRTGRIPDGETTVGSHVINIPDDAPVGTRFCVALSVTPYKKTKPSSSGSLKSQQDNQKEWRHSAPICVLVVKKPKMNIWSNGIYSKSGIRTSRTTKVSGAQFGSWAEFEALAGKKITGFTTESSHTTHNLTFKNAVPSGASKTTKTTDLGSYGAWGEDTNISYIVTALGARFSKNVPERNITVEGSQTKPLAKKVITGLTNQLASTRVIYAKDVEITGNIVSQSPSGRLDLGRIPQTIIVSSGDIKIGSDVTQIDAWLISEKTVTTCAKPVSSGLSVNTSFVSDATCGKPLRVNGPVVANKLNSWRTAGTDGEPAEVYNQRPDIYMWAFGQASWIQGLITTTYTKELPVRY